VVKDRVNAIALALAEDFRRDSDLFGAGVREADAQARIQYAMKRGFQTRDAEMTIAHVLLGTRTDLHVRLTDGRSTPRLSRRSALPQDSAVVPPVAAIVAPVVTVADDGGGADDGCRSPDRSADHAGSAYTGSRQWHLRSLP